MYSFRTQVTSQHMASHTGDLLLQQSSLYCQLACCVSSQVLELIGVPSPGYDDFQLDAFPSTAAGSGRISAVGTLQDGR